MKRPPPSTFAADMPPRLRVLAHELAILRLDETAACATPDCPNRARTVAAHPAEYQRRGRSPNGDGRYLRCKHCLRTMLLSDPPRIHARNRARAEDLLRHVAEGLPVRACLRRAGLPSPQNYYDVLDFLHRRCLAYAGAADRAVLDGHHRFPSRVRLQTARVPWRLANPRAPDQLAHCTADADTGYVLALHAELDRPDAGRAHWLLVARLLRAAGVRHAEIRHHDTAPVPDAARAVLLSPDCAGPRIRCHLAPAAELPSLDAFLARATRQQNPRSAGAPTRGNHTAPSRPDLPAKYLAIHRACHNFIGAGRDGATPAMRLGIAARPIAVPRILASRRATGPADPVGRRRRPRATL